MAGAPVGEVVARPGADAPRLPDGAPLPELTGFETTARSPRWVPDRQRWGRWCGAWVTVTAPGSEGAWHGRVLGSYLHGPVLARNAGLADLLLGWALGGASVLEPLDDAEDSALRTERLASVDDSSPDRILQRTARRIRSVVGGA